MLRHPHRLLYIAHRGGRELRPENTMPAFHYAIALGIDAIETDVRLTADERFVLIHADNHIEETTDSHGRVSAHTLDELRTLDAGSHFARRYAGTPIPGLEDLLCLARGRTPLLLDTSGDDHYYMLLLRLLQRFGVLDQVIIGVRDRASSEFIRRQAKSVVQLSFGYPENEALAVARERTEVVRFWGCWTKLTASCKDVELPVWVMAGAPNERDGGKATEADLAEWWSAGAAGVILDNPALPRARA